MPVNSGRQSAMAKKKSSARISLNAFYNEIAKRADTEGLQLSVADTKRVVACFFDVLQHHPPGVAFDLIAQGLARAARRSIAR